MSRLYGHYDDIMSVAITSDNQYIVSGSRDKTVRIWSITSNKQVSVFKDHGYWVNGIAITSDNKYVVSGSDDSTIKVWNFGDGTVEAVFQECGQVKCISVSKGLPVYPFGVNGWVFTDLEPPREKTRSEVCGT